MHAISKIFEVFEASFKQFFAISGSCLSPDFGLKNLDFNTQGKTGLFWTGPSPDSITSSVPSIHDQNRKKFFNFFQDGLIWRQTRLKSLQGCEMSGSICKITKS